MSGMRHVCGYIAVCGFSLLIACVTYIWFPTYRHCLVDEDCLVENLSAMFFLSSCFLAVFFLAKLKDHKKLLFLVSLLGLIGFLDELSFGERIFGFHMPHIGDVKITLDLGLGVRDQPAPDVFGDLAGSRF